MIHKNKIRIAWIGCIATVVAILTGCGWIFQEQIIELLNMSPNPQRSSVQVVPRSTSYLGRIRAAQEFLEQGKTSRAAIELTEAIAERPTILHPYLLLGETYIRARDFGKIAGLIEALQRKFPGAPEIAVFRARELIAREDFKAAQSLLKNADTEVLDPSMQLYQAILAALQNDHKTAQELLVTLHDLPIRDPLVLGSDGVTEVEMDDAIAPEIAQKTEALLNVYKQFDQFADGENPHLFALLAKALAENNEPVLARSFADVAIREDIAYVDAWMLRGYAHFLLNNIPSALDDLRHAYKLDPVRPEVEYFLALTLEKNGETTEAALFYEKLLTRDFPYESEVRWKLIELLSAQHEMDRVVELYQEQALLEPSPVKYVSALHTLINVLHRPEEALKLTETLLSGQPENVLSLNLRSWALIEVDQFSEARIVLNKAETLNPKNPRTQLNFGLLSEREGNPVAAREFYKKCYELGQGKPFNSVVELAVERYNTLLGRNDEATNILPAESP